MTAMPGYLLHVGAVVTCFDGGPAQPMKPNPSVTVSGQATVTQPTTYSITGCPLSANGNGCVTGTWTTATTRVTSGGQALVITSGLSNSTPNATSLKVVSSQKLVSAS
jgi:hypothetical protein